MQYQHAVRRIGAIGMLLAAALVLTACNGTSASPSSPGRSPDASAGTSSPAAPAGNGIASLPAGQILSKALAAARTAGSVHASLVATAGSLTASISTDASLTEGREVITSVAGSQATVLVVDGIGYVNANAAAWTYYFGMQSAASRLAGHWVKFTPGSTDYSDITADVTLDSAISTYTLTGQLTNTGQVTQDGKPAVGVGGTLPAAAGTLAGAAGVLYVAATGQPLPVGYQVSAGNSQVNGVFSKWGEPVSITVPASTIPF
jgi:hypothetical protein